MTAGSNFGFTAVRMFSGVLIWAVHFGAIYAFTALACTRSFAFAVPWTIAAVTAIAVIAALLMALAAWRRAAGFVDWMTAGIAGLAIVGMLWEALALAWIPACGLR